VSGLDARARAPVGHTIRGGFDFGGMLSVRDGFERGELHRSVGRRVVGADDPVLHARRHRYDTAADEMAGGDIRSGRCVRVVSEHTADCAVAYCAWANHTPYVATPGEGGVAGRALSFGYFDCIDLREYHWTKRRSDQRFRGGSPVGCVSAPL